MYKCRANAFTLEQLKTKEKTQVCVRLHSCSHLGALFAFTGERTAKRTCLITSGFVNNVELKFWGWQLNTCLSSNVMDVCHSFEVCDKTTVFGPTFDPVKTINLGEVFLANIMIMACS